MSERNCNTCKWGVNSSGVICVLNPESPTFNEKPGYCSYNDHQYWTPIHQPSEMDLLALESLHTNLEVYIKRDEEFEKVVVKSIDSGYWVQNDSYNGHAKEIYRTIPEEPGNELPEKLEDVRYRGEVKINELIDFLRKKIL